MNYRIFVLLSLMLMGNFSRAQKGIEIQISGKKVEAGEPLMVVYALTNQNERGLVRRNFAPFELAAEPQISRSMSTSIMNGQMSSSQTNSYTVYLVCKKMGKVQVPKQAFQLTDGTVIESSPIDIEVVKPGTLPRQAQRQPDPYDPFAAFFDPNYDPFSGFPPMGGRQQAPPPQQSQGGGAIFKDESQIDLKKDIFARIHVNKSKVYVGEQINASIKIYTSLNSKGFEAEKVPMFNGFWTQDLPLPDKLEMKREVINGKEFVSVEIKKILLFPTKPGVLEISPLKMKTIALVPIMKNKSTRQPRDLMEAILMSMGMSMNSMGVEFKEIPYSFSSGSEKITVLPLPANAPPTFTGGVGKFTFNAYADKKTLKTDEALNYRVELQGTGNLPLVELPKATWDEDLELYEPILKENYNVNPNFSGTKVWNYVAIPHLPGNYKTPNIEFSYFDIEQKKYVTISAPSTPLSITGKPTKDKEKGKKYGEYNYAKQKIKENLSYHASNEIGDGWMYGAGLLPLLLAVGIGMLPKREKIEDRFISGKKISEQITRQLNQAKIFLDQNKKQEFYQELTRAYWSYLGNKFRMETSALTRMNISEKLREKKIDEELIHRMVNLIDRSEMGLYTADGSQSMKELFEDSLVILNDIDKQIS